jgi:hypothetical protein
MNRDFLKEAIADAKTVKESAIANAKAALEEAFSPQLQAMFASRLEEMEKEDMDEGYDEMDEAQGEGFDSTRGNYDTDGIPGNQLEEEDELDELLAELEKDEMNEESEDVNEGKEEIEEAEEAEEDEAETEEGEAEEDEAEEGEDEEIDLEDMSEEDLKKFIEDVIEDMVSAGELEAGESFEDDVDVDVDAEGEIEVEDDELTAVDVAEGEDVDEAKKEVEEVVNTELEEALETIATLRAELNEINLLNAKLLYSNKIFKSKNMTESQKAKVLGAFDKATTVNEVKVVFETLNENFKPARKTVNEGVIGSASKATGAAQTSKQPIVESDAMVNRFKKLAGII